MYRQCGGETQNNNYNNIRLVVIFIDAVVADADDEVGRTGRQADEESGRYTNVDSADGVVPSWSIRSLLFPPY